MGAWLYDAITDTGFVDKKVRTRGMEKKRSADSEFACELERKTRKTK